jgi:hypothetical protein
MQRRGEDDVKMLSMLAGLAAGALMAATPIAATAQQAAPQAGPQQRFANGTDWANSSVAEKRAFVFGIANAISAGIGWDERHIPAGQMTSPAGSARASRTPRSARRCGASTPGTPPIPASRTRR